MSAVNLKAPQANTTYICAGNPVSGSYTSNANGVITVNAPSYLDIINLLTQGCTFIGASGGLDNFAATTDPGVTNDNTQNYAIGSTWLNTSTGVQWRAVGVATGAAEWVPQVGSGMLIGRLIGANMNTTADQAFAMTQWGQLNKFRITKITAKNASVSLTTAVGGVYTAVSKGGTAVVAATQAYSALTAATLAADLTIATTPGLTVNAAATDIWLSLTTAQGAAATADLYCYGDPYV